MLAAKFVETEIRNWLEETRPNLQNPLEYLPLLANKIILAYEEYKREVSYPSKIENPYKPWEVKNLNACKHSNYPGNCYECWKEAIKPK